MSILVTGAAGFLGRYLTAHLEGQGLGPITAAVRTKPKEWTLKTPLATVDLTDERAVEELIGRVKPSRIYHLAGHSKVTNTLQMPDYFNANFLTSARLVNALQKQNAAVRIFLASTIHVYGNCDYVATEESLPLPVNDYGYTKYLSEELFRTATLENSRLSVVVGRLYSCFGPGQAPGFVSADLCRKVAAMPDKGEGVLCVGPTSTFRRFLDVRDAVSVIARLTHSVTGDRFQVFNIASPYEVQVKDLIAALLKISGKKARVESSEDNSANRLFGIRVSCERLEHTLPGVHFRPLEETLRDMYTSALPA